MVQCLSKAAVEFVSCGYGPTIDSSAYGDRLENGTRFVNIGDSFVFQGFDGIFIVMIGIKERIIYQSKNLTCVRAGYDSMDR